MTDERRQHLQKSLLKKSNGEYVLYQHKDGFEIAELPLAVPDYELEKLASWLEASQ